MKKMKSKRIVLIVLFCSILFTNCSNSTPQSNVSPIKVAGTTWISQIENHSDYIIFNLDSTFVIYYYGLDEKIFGNYNVKDGRIIVHVLKGEFDDNFPVGSVNRISNEDYIYIIIDNQMCFLDGGKISQGKPYTQAPSNWTPPPREN